MAGRTTPMACALVNSADPCAGMSVDPPESIPKLQKLLDHIAALNQTINNYSELMQSAVSKLLELDELTQEVEEERDSLKQALESQKKVEDELNLKIDELDKKHMATHAAAIQASWEKGRAQGRKEMKEEINAHLSNMSS